MGVFISQHFVTVHLHQISIRHDIGVHIIDSHNDIDFEKVFLISIFSILFSKPIHINSLVWYDVDLYWNFHFY